MIKISYDNLIGKYIYIFTRNKKLVSKWSPIKRYSLSSWDVEVGRYIVEERATSGDNGGPQGKIIYPWGLVPKKSYSPRKFGPTCAIHPLPPPPTRFPTSLKSSLRWIVLGKQLHNFRELSDLACFCYEERRWNFSKLPLSYFFP